MYFNDPIVLGPERKLSEKFKVSKSSKIFKNIKKYWKDEIKSNKSYNDIEKTVSRKAKEHLQQEKVKCNTYEENDFQNGSYISEKCKSSLKRQRNVRCSSSKFWYDCYFPISFDLSLKQPDFVCSNCNAELFHELCCLFYLSQPMNINTFCDIWNDKVNNNGAFNFIQDSHSQVTEENITSHYIFTMSDQVSKRGFINKKSNCLVSTLLQVLHYSPLPHCLEVSKETFATTFYSLIQNMAKDTLVPMSTVELEKVTNACSMEMNL